ncbi:MAG: hypothetical protein K2I64_00770 [Muribaculaceae bacterium]|nr:hypothetical protein [Muribaculaceae bacterium]
MYGETNHQYWDYPEDVRDKDWEIVYVFLPDTIRKTCLEIRDIEALDAIVDKFYSSYANKSAEIKFSANSIRAIIMETLSYLSNIKIHRDLSFDKTDDGFAVVFDPENISLLVEWYKSNRLNIDLKSFSLYAAAEFYVKNSYVDYPYTHTNLTPETEYSIHDIFLSHQFLSSISCAEKQYIDDILNQDPDNPLITSYIRKLKLYEFTVLLRSDRNNFFK